jgi:hypothetical protein
MDVTGPQSWRAYKPFVSSGAPERVRTSPRSSGAPGQGDTFVVKLRDPQTRSWGNEHEVVAASAQDAAEQLAGGEHLVEGPGERADLRARVWKTPYGSASDLSFYTRLEGCTRPKPLPHARGQLRW